MNAAIVEMFLRSAGAPAAVLEAFQLLRKQGMDAFKVAPISADDAKWEAIGAPLDKQRIGLALSLSGPKSRISGALFLVIEGENDEIFERMSALAGTRLTALPQRN